MGGLLRKLAIFICAPIYKLIPQIYNIFFILSNHRFFTDKTIREISSNIYVLISVIMLFAFSANILAAITNPDLLTDKKKGVAALFKRAIIGLVLIVIIPFAFDEAYVIQEQVVGNNLIEKIIVGINYTEGGSTNAGQVIAGSLISSVLHPNIAEGEDEVLINEDISDDYSEMVKSNIKKIDTIKYNINITKDGTDNEKMFTDSENYAFSFDGLIALIAGFACCYLLIIFSMDMAVRIFKLAFLELTSPIIVVSYMCVGDDIFKKWIKEVGSTFVDVFVRVASLAFFIFLVGHLDGFLNNISTTASDAEAAGTITNFGIIDTFFLKTLLIIGMLIFAKQVPDLVGKVLGIKIESKGGINGRLGQMAVGGKLAQAAWKGIRNAGLLGLGAAGLALPAGIGLAAGYGINRATNGRLVSGLRKGGRAVGTFGKTAGSILKGFAADNPLTAVQNSVKGYKELNFAKEQTSERERKKMEELYENAGLNGVGQFGKGSDVRTAKSGAQAIIDKINSDNSLSQKQKRALINKITADQINELAKKATDSNDKILSEFDTMIANSSNNSVIQGKLKALKDGYMNGRMELSEVTSKVKEMAKSGEIGTAEASNVVTNAGKLAGISEFMSEDENVKVFMKDNGIDNFVTDGKLKSSSIKKFSINAETNASTAKSTYDSYASTAGEKAKASMDRYNSVEETIGKEYGRLASEIGKDLYGPNDIYESNLQSSSQSSSNNSSQSSSQVSSDYDSQFFIDDFDVHSSGDLKLKKEDAPQETVQQETVQQRVDRINNVNDSRMSDSDHSVQEAQYDELFNSNEYDDYADKNGVKKEPKFKIKDDK